MSVRTEVTAALDNWKVPWINHTTGLATFPTLDHAIRYTSLTFSRMQDQLDRIEAKLDALGE